MTTMKKRDFLGETRKANLLVNRESRAELYTARAKLVERFREIIGLALPR
jgi:hypothetical protein